MQTTPMNFKNGVTIAVLLLIIFFSVGKISKQVQTFVGSGNNLAQVQTYLLKPTGVTAVTGSACGGIVNLSWKATTGATYYQVTRNPGAVVLRSEKTSYSDTGLIPGASYQYQVRALSDTLSSDLAPNTPLYATSSAVCSTTKLPTVTLTSSSASLSKGGSSTLTWSSTEASSCVAKDAWSGSKASSGTQSVSPSSTSTYTLDCTGSGGTTSASTTINVAVPSAPTLTLSASPTSITAGQSSTISWSGTNATSCTATGGWSGTNGASGSQTVTPSTTKTYTLDCTGAGGSVSKSVTVSVTTPTTTAPKFKTGDYAQTTAGVNVRSTAGGSIAGKQVNGSLGTIISGPGQSTNNTDPYWNVDFTTGTDGWVLENYLKQTTTAPTPVPPVTPAPTLTLSASPATLTSGSSSTLTWSSTNATSCTASGAWSGTKAVSSSEAVTPTSTSTYTLVCTGTGGSASKSVTVTVSTPAPSTTYKAGDSVATTTSVNVRDVANGTLLGTKNTGDFGVVLGGGTYAGGYHWWNVDYTNAPDGWTAESFLTTYTPPATPATPPTVTISASPTSITSGSSSTLTWSSTNATSCSASGAWTGAQAISGTKTVSPTLNATYTIACTGTGGTTTQFVKITVSSVITPPPPPSGAVSLTPAKLFPAYGPLIPSSSSTIPELKKLESNFLKYEQKHYDDFITLQAQGKLPEVVYNHYGFFGSRLSYSIKNGLSYGSGVTDPTKDMYARGKKVASDWLINYSLPAGYGVAQWWDTSLDDMEAMVVLENDPTARIHIHMDAAKGTANSSYMRMKASKSDPRAITIFLQPMLTAHRLGIPFVHPKNGYSGWFDTTLGSWANAAKRNIYWLDQYNVIQSDGTVLSNSHKAEAYFMSAMLADQLLGYYAYIERDPVVFAMAQRVVDHWINKLPAGWNTLGYLSTYTSQDPDLASFYVYPSLVMWQETGQQKYYDFAVKNLVAAGKAYVSGHKQFNQIYNTDVFAADALINGVSWKPATPTYPVNQTTLAFAPVVSSVPSMAGQAVTIANGQSVDLTWTTFNASSCAASGAWSGAQGTSGKVTISPTVTSTYTLSCPGTYGTATQSVKVTVK